MTKVDTVDHLKACAAYRDLTEVITRFTSMEKVDNAKVKADISMAFVELENVCRRSKASSRRKLT